MNKYLSTVILALGFTALSCINNDFNNPVDSGVPLPTPSSVIISSMTISTVTVQWTYNISYLSKCIFEIQQSTDNANFTLVKTVPVGITSATINGVFDSVTTYYFRVRAIAGNNISGYSNIASIFLRTPSGMVFIQGGTFQMGSTSRNSDEQPAHAVTLNSFWVDKYEVTRARWREVVVWKQGASTLPLNPDPSYYKSNDTLPVEEVKWNDIQTWIVYLNEKEGTTKYRLPTEAEWEYAARGGVHWLDNYTYSGDNNINSVGWYSGNSGSQTHVVGTKTPNELGIYDMSGNVWEWCQDWYGAYPADAQTNPFGPSSGSYRVLRGGSCDYGYSNCSVSSRIFEIPSISWGDFGFRCVRDL